MFGSFSLYHQEEDDLLQVLTFFLQNDTTKRAAACQSTRHPLGFRFSLKKLTACRLKLLIFSVSMYLGSRVPEAPVHRSHRESCVILQRHWGCVGKQSDADHWCHQPGCPRGCPTGMVRINGMGYGPYGLGLWDNFNRKALYLMVKTMVSCKCSLKPIQWLWPIWPWKFQCFSEI